MTAPVLPFTLPGCRVDAVRTDASVLLVEAHTTTPTAMCPDCHQPSTRVHSRYIRLLRDLPVTEQAVRLLLRVRRFFCPTATCPRRTFAERLPALAPFRAQRTQRLTHSLRVLGLALGGQHGARIADQFHMQLSADTLLRIIRATPSPDLPPPRVVGIDDFAFRKGHLYGTLIVNLEQARPIELLADRSAESVATWLRGQPQIEVIARDRAADYVRGATDGAPQAVQVADRFHLLGNARDVIEHYVQRMTPALRRLLVPEPESQVPFSAHHDQVGYPPPRYAPTAPRQQLHLARVQQREQRYQYVKTRAVEGVSQQQIASETGLSTRTIRRWLRTTTLLPDQRRYHGGSKIDRYVAYLHTRLAEGCTNQTRLWQEIREQGFSGTQSLVSKWVRTQQRAATPAQSVAYPRLPAPKPLAWLIFQTKATRTSADQQLWEQLQAHDELRQVHDLIHEFARMVRQRQAEGFDRWLQVCRTSAIPEIKNFADGLVRDYAAVKAALTLPWSTGPVEGHINRLKLVKRSGYGRMQIDLLRQRVLHAT
jgi:transposase